MYSEELHWLPSTLKRLGPLQNGAQNIESSGIAIKMKQGNLCAFDNI
jgi:hypothetical protein